MPNAHKLACSTDKKRRAMAARLAEIGRERGWVSVTTKGSTHEIKITLQRPPYVLSCSFDRLSRVHAFLGHWFTMDNKATYPTTFGVICRGSVNHSNATTCVDTFEEFCDAIAAGLEVLNP